MTDERLEFSVRFSNLMKIAIIGKGNVGSALASGLKRASHEVTFGHRDPKEPVREAAKSSEVIILAVPFGAIKDVARQIGSAAYGKVLIDVTNALGSNMELMIGFTASAAEEVQKYFPRARIVKAFNAVFAENMGTGKIGKKQLSAFITSDDSKAKQTAMQIARDIGFDAVDAGPLKPVCHLEPMAMLLIGLGYNLGVGTKIGFKLVRG